MPAGVGRGSGLCATVEEPAAGEGEFELNLELEDKRVTVVLKGGPCCELDALAVPNGGGPIGRAVVAGTEGVRPCCRERERVGWKDGDGVGPGEGAGEGEERGVGADIE